MRMWGPSTTLLVFLVGCESLLQCPDGYEKCDGDCYNIQQHSEHCGACGRACEGGRVCYAGSCVEPCFDECTGRVCWSSSTYSDCDDSRSYCQLYGDIQECLPGEDCPCVRCSIEDQFEDGCSSWSGYGEVSCPEGSLVIAPGEGRYGQAEFEIDEWYHHGWSLRALVSLDEQGSAELKVHWSLDDGGVSFGNDDSVDHVIVIQNDGELEGVSHKVDQNTVIEHRMSIVDHRWYEIEVECSTDGHTTLAIDDRVIGQYTYDISSFTLESVSIMSVGTYVRVESIELCPPLYQ